MIYFLMWNVLKMLTNQRQMTTQRLRPMAKQSLLVFSSLSVQQEVDKQANIIQLWHSHMTPVFCSHAKPLFPQQEFTRQM